MHNIKVYNSELSAQTCELLFAELWNGNAFNDPEWTFIKHKNQFFVAHHQSHNIWAKSFVPKNSLSKTKDLFRGDAITRSIKGNQYVKNAGLEAPTIFASASKSDNQIILMSDISGPTLHDYIASYLIGATGKTLKTKQQLFHQLGFAIAKLHRNGIVHGDLRPNNIIITNTKNGLSFGLIDNERTRKPIKVEYEKIRNLIQLMILKNDEASKTDKFRILSSYCQQMCYSRQQKKKFLLSLNKRYLKRLVEIKEIPAGKIITDKNFFEEFSDKKWRE